MRAALCALAMLAAAPVVAQSPLPFNVGGPFTLTDDTGAQRTQADPNGLPQLLFFGYANCPGICTAALPLMGGVVDALADAGVAARPVMITVDPARDKVGTMEEPLTRHHPAFVGLTGTDDALEVAYTAFSIERSLAYEDPTYGAVYTHGSFIYLLDPEGAVLTLIPPVLDTPSASKIALKYLAPGES